MDYEKKYKEALENARQEYNTTENVERKQWLEELFPELKERRKSKDKRIKKVYLEKEFDNYIKDIMAYDVQSEPFTQLYNCAEYFFELGLKQKGK